jgi:hypothetical protein
MHLAVAGRKFEIDHAARLFCIGSCFARHVEEVLHAQGYLVDSLNIAFPRAEWHGRANGLMNKFTVMSMLNEIEWAFGAHRSPEALLVPVHGGYLDCQMCAGHAPVDRQRGLERREQARQYFAQIRDAGVVVMTLGHVEAWYDTETELYLNMAPPRWAMRHAAERFELHVTGYHENVLALMRVMERIHDHAPNARVIVTVSPVPLSETFTGQDLQVANCYSKSVLRAVATDVTNRYEFTDYFASFEAVQSLPPREAYEPDRIHVRPNVVSAVVNHFLASYVTDPNRGAASLR